MLRPAAGSWQRQVRATASLNPRELLKRSGVSVTLLPDEPLLFFPDKSSPPQRFAPQRQLAEGAEPFWGLLSPLDAPEIVIFASDSHSWTELRELVLGTARPSPGTLGTQEVFPSTWHPARRVSLVLQCTAKNLHHLFHRLREGLWPRQLIEEGS